MPMTGLKGFNLSIQQAHLWSLQNGDKQPYCTQCAIRVSGELNMEAFQQAIQWVMDQHSILRTSFLRVVGMDVPVQVINDQMEASFVVIDLSQLRTETQVFQLETCFTLMQSEDFDLMRSPLLRTRLLRLSMDTHVMLISLPSLCADDRTLLLYVTELNQAYALKRQVGLLAEETEEPLQYVDVAAWQDELLLEEEAELHRQYWRKIDLAQVATMPLPVQGREAGNKELAGRQANAFSPRVLDVPIDATLLTQIKKLTHYYHISLADYLLACWYVSCLKITNAANIIIGTACDGRFHEELKNALGIYKRFVPININLAENVAFEQVITLMGAHLAEAYEEQIYFSWDDNISRTKSADISPYFPISFEYDLWPATLQAGPLTFSLLKCWSCTEPFVLKLSARQIGEHLQLAFHYDPRQVTDEQVSHLAVLFHTLLMHATEQPQTQIGALSLLSSAARTRLLTAFRAPQRSWPAQGLHHLFEAQVQRHPNQIAVVSSQEQMTYQQLNEQANQLAWVLRQRGVRPGELVGLFMPRQAHMLVGMLGILKAGGAYLPLDAASPAARLEYQLRESQVKLLLTQEEMRADLPTWEGSIHSLQEWKAELVQAPIQDLDTGCTGEDLAYVIYTSGSTGRPKGVMVRQSSVVNYTLALCEQLGAEAGWQYATVSTLAADLGNTAIFCALASGGCVQVLDYELVTSAEAMATWTRQHPIDVLKIVPSHLSALLESERAHELLPRRALVLGGEPLSKQLVEWVRLVGGTCRVYNHYGPTETTIGVLVNVLGERGEEVEDMSGGVALGCPISNTQVYVLDQSMRLVPEGVSGELYIGGAGLARGYWGQVEQTAERFVPHPYSEVGGERLYRTGDIVRCGKGEWIEFVGRRDGQVKLRGYRIEVGEIEAVMRQHSQIRDCVVMLRKDTMDEPQLVSYVVGKQRMSIPHEKIKEWLRQRLPEYMLPTAYVQMDELPLTTNGKVDRDRLPRPEQHIVSGTSEVVQLHSPLEEMVAQVWRDLLGVAVIGAYDNFFMLGGHSLLATRVIGRLQAILQVALPVQLLFEAPTVAALVQRIEQILRQGDEIDMPPLVASIRPEQIPLSFAQQRLWFLEQLEPGSTAYLVPSVFKIEGEIVVSALERSVQELVMRHESLRTVFAEQAGQPVQIIRPAVQVKVPVIDLQGLKPEQRDMQARQLANQERLCPCDLTQGPLLRLALLRLEPQAHVLLLTLHHIITDGWSSDVLVRELTSLYRTYVAGQPSLLSPLALQYADYALWQRQWLQGEVLEKQLAYWRRQLVGAPSLALPTDHPRPAIQTARGASQVWHLPQVLSQGVEALSQHEHVTVFMTLLASFQVLLARYTGQYDISVGTPIANRRYTEVEDVIGFFVNTLVLRTDLLGNPSFVEVLQRVRKVCLEAYTHQDVPFEQVVEAVEPVRDLSRSPLFQVMFVLQQAFAKQEVLASVRMQSLEVEQVNSKFDLALSVTETGHGLHVLLEYSTDLFEAETIRRLLEHWQILLQGIVECPQTRLSNLPLLTATEREHLLGAWNATWKDYPQGLCVQDLFEQQAERIPDAIALVFAEEMLTYNELNQRANRLAHYLQGLGVGPEVRVGICMDRSIEMIIGVLGILKAGGAYVPLDPTYPQKRLSFIKEDAQVTILLTQRHLQGLEFASHMQVVVVEQIWRVLHDQPASLPVSRVSVDNLAYIIYTSGSTGRPKGVEVTHRGLGNLALAQAQAFASEQGSRVLQFASLNFDASVWEILMALLGGGSLHLEYREKLLPGAELIKVLQEQAISIVTLPPSALAVLPQEAAPALRTLVVAGEACPVEVMARWAPGRHFFNAYGPTEATVCASMTECWVEHVSQGGLSLGEPLANTQMYLLDQYQQPVPAGVVGEIYLGGIGLARGYCHMPEVTAERFIPHAWSQEPGARLYRTGDLARYRVDGKLEYLGRVDQQVKIRGHRIELGEIEAVLGAHPALREAVVVARQDGSGEPRLIAYLVGQLAGTLNTRELRGYLQERLPAAMIPSAFVVLDAFPLNANGKVDRRALPEPQESQQREGRGRMEARTPIEELVQGLWKEVLRRTEVGLEENFFELGGHSLLAAQLIGRLRKMLAVEVPLRAVFEAPTVAMLAQRIERTLRREEASAIPPLQTVERPEVLPLSFAQQRLWFLDQLEPGSTAYLILSALKIEGQLNVSALERCVQELVSRHESLRTIFVEQAGQPVQIIMPVVQVRMPVIDLQGLPSEQREVVARQLARQEGQCPCDLAQGPLLRLSVVRLEPEAHVMLLTLHHLITDGWSNEVLVRELTTLYRAFRAGQPSPLPPLPLQYADYALWQRQWLQGEVLEKQLTYWRKQLMAIAPLDLPTDYPRPRIQTYRGAMHTLRLPTALSERLRVLSQQEDVTLFMLLLASFQVLLARYIGQHDISVGTPVANRRHAESEELIGFFVNTLVLRTDLSGNPSFVEVLQRVREMCLEAYAHQDVPFESIVEAVEPERDLSRSPLFQIMFLLQHAPRAQEELVNIRMRSLNMEQVSSKFDLTLAVTEIEQGLHVTLEYNTDLFEAATMQRLLGHWQQLLEGVVQNPQNDVWGLPLLSRSEQIQVLETWNATRRTSRQEECIHQLFEQQVQRTPDAIALTFEEMMLTYDQLNRRANQLAHYLHKLGIGPEKRVGLYLERSFEMVIGLLGVLKAGGAYVPLDTSTPAERLAVMLEDIQAIALLTREKWRNSLLAEQKKLICLDTDWETIAGHDTANPHYQVLPVHLAYVIYTSGSTGKPKGVLITHANLVHSTQARFATYEEPVRDYLLLSPFFFDSSVAGLYWTLCQGGRLVLLREDFRVALAQIPDLIMQQHISHLLSIPALYALILQQARPEQLASLQTVIVAGEICPASLVQRHQESIPQAELYNEYGPTEGTVWSSVYRCQPQRHEMVVPIGRPITNMQMYLLGHGLHPVPIGVVGEVYIGGIGLARGYSGRPDLTAEKFVANPFATEAGERLYRTGDLARYRADGVIEYLGRVDQQVKIRGYRIELGEIEAVLGAKPAIREAIVMVREDVPGEQHLVAYVVGQATETLNTRELRGYLQERLPAAMIPSAFVVLDAFPLNANGKVDRRALPVPQEVQQPEGRRRMEAGTPMEGLVQGLCKEVLRCNEVGRDENFFELGGHSLLAAQLIGRLRKMLGVEIPLRAVFEAPTVAMLAQRIEQVLPQEEASVLPALQAVERPEVLPLSFAQQRLWFLDQLEPGSTAYLLPSVFQVEGPLDVSALARSVQELVSRHESLRTVFAEQAGQPVQIIKPVVQVKVPVIDLQGLPTEQRDEQAQQLAKQERLRPCDLGQGPLLRLSVVRLEPEAHVMLLTLHHIITDGWSNEVLVRELITLYRAFRAGQPSPLSPLALQYTDYALWQRQWLQGAVLEAQLAYWRTQLTGAPSLALPTDHPRPAVQTACGASLALHLPVALSEGVRALSQQEHVTEFMTLLAAFQVLLARYTGQHDISVGTPIANRRQAESEGIIGFFVNTLVLRTDLLGNPSFVELLQRVREVCLGAYAHQDVPFESVVEAVEPVRDLSRSPLFQVMFVLQNTPRTQEELVDVRVSPLKVEQVSSKFDLSLSVTENEQGLTCALEYNTDLFEAETIQRMLGHWQTLLQGLVQTPQIPLSELPLFSEDERTHLLRAGNTQQAPYPAHLCLHDLFTQQVARTPDALAVEYGQEQVTYAQLHRLSNQVAHHLQQLGVGPEVLVGIGLERSIEFVIGILGVLKAGGAYVPLDLSYPEQRLASLVKDAQLSIVLTKSHLGEALPPVEQVVCLDTDWAAIDQYNGEESPTSTTLPTHLAYVLYTSGSTGQPKGVMITHQGVVQYVYWSSKHYMVADGSGSPVHSPLSFDLTITSLFPPLVVGRRLVLIPETPGIEALCQILLQERAFSVLKMTPAHLNLLNQALRPEHLSSIAQALVIGGEALHSESVRIWREQAPATRLINEYGPTETVVGCCIYEIPQDEQIIGAVPIGRPIPNTQFYLLDAHMQVVPFGVPGELYIGGVGLGRGYLNRADQTAERFMPNPFSREPGARLYKTGDLVRYREDGNLEYLGRKDQQVKVRGYRIELGEIEAVLQAYPAIQEAVVLLREDQPGDKRLVAYVVVQPGQILNGRELRTFLQDRLPAYMVPAACVQLEMWPLTANGKLDRRALPVPENRQGVDSGEESRTQVEELLVGIWCKVLGLSQAGIHENFFELGGHSLLATQVIGQVRQMLGVEIPLRALFEAPTIAGFALRVEQALRRGETLPLPPLLARKRPEMIPLSFAQQRLWFLDQLEPGSTAYLLPSMLKIEGQLAVSALERSMQELVGRHESLRTVFIEQAGQTVQIIKPVAQVKVPVIDLQGLEPEQREAQAQQLANQEGQRPCNLALGPLLRLYLLRLEPEAHVLLLTLHHIITDGWSNRVLVRELTTLYRAFVAGQPSPLSPLTLQYADYALWQRQWLQGVVLEAQLAYWRTQLTGAPSLALPTDHPRPVVQTFQGASQTRYLPVALSEKVQMLSQQEYVTMFMLLLASFQALLMRYSGQHDICVGTPVANRRQAESEGMIGFFVNTLVLRTDLTGDPSFEQVLQRVREVCLGAYAHQDVPFEQVVEALEPVRDLSRSPLFQVMFMLQHASAEQEESAAVRMQSLEMEQASSKFDLTLSVTRTAHGLRTTCEYSTDLFEVETINRLLEHWQILLEGIVESPQSRLSELSLLTADEREQLLSIWNATQQAYPEELSLQELFEQQVERTPDAIAVADAEMQLSYTALNRRANQLACVLRRRGINLEERVGICLEHCCDLVVAILATLKAGATYVPLDPALPAQRLAFMLTDVEAKLLLTQRGLTRAEHFEPLPIMYLDQGGQELVAEATHNLAIAVESRQAAYIIYTSGSTGQPKGVIGSHRSLINRLGWSWQAYPFRAGERCCQKTSLGFVDAITELFVPLLQGIPVVLLDSQQRADPLLLLEALAKWQVSRLVLVPSLLHTLLESVSDLQERVPALQLWVSSGEALPGALVRRFSKALAGRTLLNLYGSSEVAGDATAERVQGLDEVTPIGRPLANVQTYILDANMRLVPVGVVGDLYIGGDGLARGYINRPELTAARFVPHPFGLEAGERLYKTGDLARYRADGAIEYLGRVDQQVKIRGHRIELGEIEVVLGAHPALRQAVVVARPDVAGDRRLVAYVVGQTTETLSPQELRGFLRERLPAAMIPSAFVVLDALPLNANGKVDRRALPEPQESQQRERRGRMEARTPIEELVQGLWKEVLRRTEVGLEENFFELGGHSLLVAQLIGRLRKMLAVEVPLRAVFEAPTVAMLAQRIEWESGQNGGKALPPLMARKRPEWLPLSFAQQRLWFLDQLEPNSPAYLIPSVFQFEGLLDVSALEHSVQELVRRHESLRTVFAEQADQPVQIIKPVDQVKVPVIDLQGFPTEQREAQAQQLANQEGQRPCDLAQGPLLRLYLLRLEPEAHVMLLTLHHIITDGWSNGVLVRELTSLYRAYVAGQPSPLPPLPIQYADYALWQREWLQGETLEQQLAYWRTQLTGVPSLTLPIDHPHPAVQTFRGASQTHYLPVALSEKVQALSQQELVTMFMLLLASFQVLLMRYSGQDDISVGTPVANRRQTESEGIIGFFVNTLVLRTDLRGDPCFVEVLQRVREVCLGAYAHQDVPFEQVVEALEPVRDLSRSPLFQVMFLLQHASAEQDEQTAVRVRSMRMEQVSSKFDLTLSVTETGHGLHAELEYNTDLFEAETINRLLEHWQILLEGIVESPQSRLSELPLLTAHERERLLGAWNAALVEYPRELCVHDIFEQQVERTPDAVAVAFGEEILTYAELNRRTNQLAHYLQSLGVGPDVLVGICMERCIEMVVGLLGILKAGGAYVPLDPTYPLERQRFILQDTHTTVLLTQQHLLERLPHQQVQTIDLAKQWKLIGQQKVEDLHCSVKAENLAYVMYTSGSTGRPKGIEVRHRSIIRLIFGMDFVPLESGQTLLQLAPISFDASTFEIWGALLHGGRCVLYPDAIPTTRDIGVIIDTQGVTTLWLTASLFNMIIDEEPEILHRLRYLLTGGEALSVSHVLRALAQVPMIQLINGYGPTESTTFTCCYCIPASLSEDTRSIPLGPPIGNTQIYILDAHLNVVPMGVVGELYIGGDGLARGYVNRPELTADRFVPNPFSREPGARLYKAGDMVRYRTDGALEFCGRRDQQVKIRGHRIELGEIEAVLGGYPAVQGAVVVMRQDVLGEQCLVAYLVEQTGETLSSRELRVFLQERLPAYLIPSAFVVLDAFPLTPNGKVDRRALPEPQALQERDGRERAPARTPIEEMIQGLWKEVLACQEVGLDENFFELGGHSLLAAQLVGRLRRMLGVEISLRAIFEAPSVAALAQRVEQALRQNEASSLPPLQVIERPERLPLSFAQQRLWFLDQLEPESPAYLVPSVLKVEGQLDVSALERSVQELVSRHESLRTVFVEREGQPVQVIKPTAQVRVPVIDLQSLLPEQRAVQTQQLANQEGQRPCNLAQGPLLRLYLLRLEPEAHVMLLTLHHIITDGWSNEVLVRELTTLYRAFRAGQPSPLLPLPLQYADYALWQRSWLQGEMLQQQIAYWKKQLWRVSPLELPTDVPRTAVQGRRGAQHTFTLPDALFARCCAMSQQEEVTLFMTLLAAFQVLLARYSGQEDIVVGTDVANRTHLETEGLIGFFVNQLVVRSHVSGQYTFRELLHQVRKTTMDAYLHQDIPFEKIVEALLPDRRSQATPLFSVKMLLHVVSTEEASSQKAPDLSGVNVDALFLPLEMTAKLDLILRLIQTPKGMRGVFDYRADLFQATTIERMAQHFLVLLESICAKPDERLNILEMFTQQEKEERHMRRKEREATLSTKLKSVRPTSVRFGDEQLIRTEYLPEQHSSN